MKSQVRTYIKNNYKFELYVENRLMYCEMYKEDEYVGKAECSFAHFGGKALCTFTKYENTTGVAGFAFLSEKDFTIFERFMKEQQAWQNQELTKIELAKDIEEKTELENVEVVEDNNMYGEEILDGRRITIKVNNTIVKIQQYNAFGAGLCTGVDSKDKELAKTLREYFVNNPLASEGTWETRLKKGE